MRVLVGRSLSSPSSSSSSSLSMLETRLCFLLCAALGITPYVEEDGIESRCAWSCWFMPTLPSILRTIAAVTAVIFVCAVQRGIGFDEYSVLATSPGRLCVFQPARGRVADWPFGSSFHTVHRLSVSLD